MTSFSDLGLSPEVIQAVADAGYDTPTPIQEKAIPVALSGRDVLGIAQTGTGKTAAFTLPMIDRLASGRPKARMPRALVIAPTRELADQVSASFEKYAKGRKLSWALLIGGVSFKDQEMKLDRGVDVLIATPGRLLDHFERGKLLLTGVQMLVVDEADRMLDMGFIPDIERIFKMTPPKKQTLFFSATMPPEITRLTKQFLNDPERIEASRPAQTAETITQHLVRIPSSDPAAKRLALRALIGRDDVRNGIVFCNRKTEVDVVAKSLRKHGLDASPIHGDLDQSTRMKTLADFRSGALKLLVASDVAARGLDIPDVSHVFNYDVPHHADDYVHRIGRTGRAGKLGQTFMLITPADGRQLDKVLKLIGKTPLETPLDDVDFSQISERPARPRSDRPERGGRSRGGRAERPSREAPEAPAPDRVAEPSEPVSTPEIETAPRPDRSTRGRRRRGGSAPDVADVVEAVAQPEPAAEEAAPRREPRQRSPRREAPARDSAPQQPAAAPSPAAARGAPPLRGVKTPDPNEDAGDRVVGFGREVPAFLQRSVPSKPVKS